MSYTNDLPPRDPIQTLKAHLNQAEAISRQARMIEQMRQLLQEIYWHRNGGSALPSSWDHRVTEVLETNGPA